MINSSKKHWLTSTFLIKIVALFSLFILNACTAIGNNADKPVYWIYLAGPEVFLPEPVRAGEQSKKRILELNQQYQWPFELRGLYPLDNEIADFGHNYETGIRIYDANIDLMNRADFVAANMVRFRGPSMDVGLSLIHI